MICWMLGPVLGCKGFGKLFFTFADFLVFLGIGFFFTLGIFSLATAFKPRFLDGVPMVNGNIRKNAARGSALLCEYL